jgi:hypothetical protein
MFALCQYSNKATFRVQVLLPSRLFSRIDAYLNIPVIDGGASLLAVFSLAVEIAQPACNSGCKFQPENNTHRCQ